MRIPLDYYRILSVPVKATAAQLSQAYNDRLLQQPRREYSDLAIKARQELIQYSYQVLSDPEQRASYDAQFLLNMQPLVTPEAEDESASEETEEAAPTLTEEPSPLANPTIEIPSTQIIGALIILQELGEYETVLDLGINYFNQRSEKQSQTEGEVSLDTTQEDLILTLTLAYMELGREQWHRREYENAALSSQLGIDLLDQKSLFPHLQEELSQDLSKLRPYRVLELISQNPTQSESRAEGFRLLQSMLIQRQGIEGKGEDRSGLNFDQFLCFIQQLRTYLTSAEQQQLFDSDSQAKSAIANYLAVYALLGRGFSLKQPELVLRAQRKLDYLAEKQDVSWEQSISALLLGHTQKAIYKLKNAPDSSQLQKVQQHSLGNSDLLPGLCFYGEQWLLQDVQAQFSDLSTTELTLKEYFADPQVQVYLEELAPPSIAKVSQQQTVSEMQADGMSSNIMSFWRNMFSGEKSVKAQVGSATSSREQRASERTDDTVRSRDSSTAVLEHHPVLVTASALEREDIPPTASKFKKPLTLPLQHQKTRAVPASVIQRTRGKQKKRPRRKRSRQAIWKGRLFVASCVFGAGLIGYLGTKLLLAPSTKTANKAQLAIALGQPSVEIPVRKVKPVAAKPKLTFTEESKQVIQQWLSSKSAAFGSEHKLNSLNSILAEPLLTTWRDRATAYQQENIYRQYEHNIVMKSATVDPSNKNKAIVEAEVKEVAKHYQGGQLDNAQSYDDNLLVRYQLVRQGEKWLIQQTEVLKTL